MALKVCSGRVALAPSGAMHSFQVLFTCIKHTERHLHIPHQCCTTIHSQTCTSFISSSVLPPMRARTNWGDRAFEMAAPTIWNNLPINTRMNSTIDKFKKDLKTHLFFQPWRYCKLLVQHLPCVVIVNSYGFIITTTTYLVFVVQQHPIHWPVDLSVKKEEETCFNMYVDIGSQQ